MQSLCFSRNLHNQMLQQIFSLCISLLLTHSTQMWRNKSRRIMMMNTCLLVYHISKKIFCSMHFSFITGNCKYILIMFLQNTTTMLLQGERLNPQMGSFVIPAAMLNVFKMAIIVLLLPLLDRVIYPLLHRYNKTPSILQRIGRLTVKFSSYNFYCERNNRLSTKKTCY